MATEPAGTVASIWRFPVKSMQGERLERAEAGDRGLAGDRAYAVVDTRSGKVISAKHPHKWPHILDFAARFVEPPSPDGALPPVEITLPDGSSTRSDAADVDAMLSGALDAPVTLSAAVDQPTYEAVWPDVEGVVPDDFLTSNSVGTVEGQTLTELALSVAAPPGTFFDVSTLHVITTATLRRLAALAPGSTFDVRRYRPNVAIECDGDTFVENDWPGATLAFGDEVTASALIPTMRCVMTTVAQPGLPRDLDVLKTVARNNRVDIPGIGTWACAGVYASITAGGALAVGDTVTVTR
jgi:uncharacterized protein YcbX